jgi:arabinofuranosyltransferase
MSRRHRLLLALISVIALAVGFRAFLFLCDDAFIEFRYVANAHRGLGFVWNPPPFRPVEGYTSFLWVALLSAVWELTGIQPPAASLALSWLFSVGTVLLVVDAATRLPLTAAWEPYRVGVAWAVVLSTLSNRAFLSFTSSGLETPLWTFAYAAWACSAALARWRSPVWRRSRRWSGRTACSWSA